MPDEIAVQFKDVYETYDLEIKTEGKTFHESFEALKGISFSVNRGECLAIIGPNGAGKSTVLRLLAGLLRPEKGEVKAYGRVSSLLDLGAGFHTELTGRDNLLLNASLYNFSHEEIAAKQEQILAFADIGKFVDAPVRCYSQGMYVRLAFSLAIHVDPQILLIDDCLAVGDDDFRIKSFDKVLEFKERGKTIVFVTHDFGAAKQLCRRGLYLKEGKVVKDGDIEEVIAAYVKPLDVDKAHYKYLSERISEEEEILRKQEAEYRRIQEENLKKDLAEKLKWEEEEWRRREVFRRQKEVEDWTRQEEARRQVESEAWNRKEADRRKSESLKWSEEDRQRLLDAEAWARQEEARRKTESDAWDKKEANRRQLDSREWDKEQEKRSLTDSEAWVKREEARRKAESEKWNEQEMERRRAETEKWDREEAARRKAMTAAREKEDEEYREKETESWERWRKQEAERRQSEAGKWDLREEARRNDERKKGEELQKNEREAWDKTEMERRQVLVEEWSRQEVERRRAESEAWNVSEESRQKNERETWDKKEAERRQALVEEWSRQEEAHRKNERETWDKKEAERRQALVDEWSRQEVERRKAESEAWNILEEQRRKMHGKPASEADGCSRPQKARETPPVTLGNNTFRMEITPCRVRLFSRNIEMTSGEGIRSLFLKGDADVSSMAAVWRIRKTSDSHVVCFLKWPKPLSVFQAWHFSLLPDGSINWEIDWHIKDFLLTRNERVECCSRVDSSVPDQALLGNKGKVFLLGKNEIRFETFDDDKIAEISPQGPYFLTVCDRDEAIPSGQGRRRSFFKGRFAPSPLKALVSQGTPSVQKLESGSLQLLFQGGSCQLAWGKKVLTVGFGLYTSLFSRGIWRDSTQAKWKVEELTNERLLLKGFWPWAAIAQTWEIALKDEKNIFFKCKMKVFREEAIRLQETVLMLSDTYKSWREGKEPREFPAGFTNDDLFRICSWAAPADGKRGIVALSEKLPGLKFKPALMKGHQIVAESAAHIYDTRCRLLHCMRANKGNDQTFAPGEYDFFEGSITVEEEERL